MFERSRRLAALAVLGLCACSATLAQDATGTWKTDDPPVVIQLHQRSDGSLLGYNLSMESFVAGTVIGSGITLAIDTGDPDESELLVLDGTFSDTTMTLSSPDGPVTLDKVGSVYDEQRYLILPMSPSGDPDAVLGVDAAVAVTGSLFHTGTFEARHRCDLFACSGDVTNLVVIPATDGLQIDLEWNDGCPGTASIDIAWDPVESFCVGSYTVTDCQGVRGDSIAVALDRGTRTDHVASVLESLAVLADDMESEASFATDHPSIDASYLHAGDDDASMRASLDA